MIIDYTHSKNPHALSGPGAAWPKIFAEGSPASVLDVGCGIGTWIKTAMNAGVEDVFGIDGVEIPAEQLLFPANKFLCRDLTRPVDLGRRFDVVICLEVGEHLDANASGSLIQTLTCHSDTIIFSAACPGQAGQHHVNCQWPEYWQRFFNSAGFMCEDTLRFRLWDDPAIEFWYKQNMFIARRGRQAGKEPRLKSFIHPGMQVFFEEYVDQIEKGRMPAAWYLRTPPAALFRKLFRKCF
jgi:SAM-dependent methyltransferase